MNSQIQDQVSKGVWLSWWVPIFWIFNDLIAILVFMYFHLVSNYFFANPNLGKFISLLSKCRFQEMHFLRPTQNWQLGNDWKNLDFGIKYHYSTFFTNNGVISLLEFYITLEIVLDWFCLSCVLLMIYFVNNKALFQGSNYCKFMFCFVHFFCVYVIWFIKVLLVP